MALKLGLPAGGRIGLPRSGCSRRLLVRLACSDLDLVQGRHVDTAAGQSTVAVHRQPWQACTPCMPSASAHVWGKEGLPGAKQGAAASKVEAGLGFPAAANLLPPAASSCSTCVIDHQQCAKHASSQALPCCCIPCGDSSSWSTWLHVSSSRELVSSSSFKPGRVASTTWGSSQT